MVEMQVTIVVKRLVRSLRYRQTYAGVYELFLRPEPHPEVLELLQRLIGAQQTAAVLVTGYLRGLDVCVTDLPRVQRLLDRASSRKGVRSRMRFVHYGLIRSVSWYREQLVDRQMIADPDLKQLLFELGEMEASSLWRTQMVMARLGIRDGPAPEDPSGVRRTRPGRAVYRASEEMNRAWRPPWRPA